LREFFCFTKRKLFRFGNSLQAFCADSFSDAVDFFNLKVNHEFSKRLYLGMANLISRLRSSVANFTDSTHTITVDLLQNLG